MLVAGGRSGYDGPHDRVLSRNAGSKIVRSSCPAGRPARNDRKETLVAPIFLGRVRDPGRVEVEKLPIADWQVAIEMSLVASSSCLFV